MNRQIKHIEILSTKEAILKVACTKYLESGDHGLSMRKIARELGITPMAIYRHFDNKDALQQELLIEAFRTFMNYLYSGLKGKSPRDRFHLSAEAFFDFAVQQSTYFELIFLAIKPMNNMKFQKRVREESLPSFRFLTALVQECISCGYFKKGNVYEISVSLLAQSIGIAALYLTNSFSWNEEEARIMRDKAFRHLLTGFLN
jgi:AcrR family transcriptional regulator